MCHPISIIEIRVFACGHIVAHCVSRSDDVTSPPSPCALVLRSSFHGLWGDSLILSHVYQMGVLGNHVFLRKHKSTALQQFHAVLDDTHHIPSSTLIQYLRLWWDKQLEHSIRQQQHDHQRGAKIKADPINHATHKQHQQYFDQLYEKLKADPIAYALHLEKARERDKKRKKVAQKEKGSFVS